MYNYSQTELVVRTFATAILMYKEIFSKQIFRLIYFSAFRAWIEARGIAAYSNTSMNITPMIIQLFYPSAAVC